MATIREWLGDAQQRAMTHLVNRSCKRNPSPGDRLAQWLLARLVGEAPEDPELQHPE